ncbi:hypothetical protein SAMD00019534_070940, partial [Acytostelium subglobosum LB1]|uniref:hypothetical protein n=1 Tax=Acytostelium subglobosum LB1 TaxID=1410327 RepID=UPI000644F478
LFVVELGIVMCSWRIVSLVGGGGEGASFKERVHSLTMMLVSDIFTVLMLVITLVLFCWRAKRMIGLLRSSPSNKWKSIVSEQFYDGGVEFCCFTALLLIKWPVVFQTLWTKDPQEQEKLTWYDIFIKEFTKNSPVSDLFTGGSASSSAASGGGTGGGSSSSSSSSSSRGTLSDEEWKRAFRTDMKSIGFEFDKDGEITKFPPTEVMEQYQKSDKFRELILQASGGPQRKSDDITIKDSSQQQQQQPTTEQQKPAEQKQHQHNKQQESNKKKKKKN